MLKYFNKEKKKSSIIITSVLPIEEFFARGDTEIGTDFWKMNASQLEEVVKKEEQYIKNLKKLYTQVSIKLSIAIRSDSSATSNCGGWEEITQDTYRGIGDEEL